jgi:hypothetical protein
MHRITFDIAQPVSPADPYRMDVACFIGFVPQRSSNRLPDSLHAWLTRNHWEARVSPSGSAPGYELLDVPVPVESWEGFQTLFAGGHRLDGEIEIPGAALTDSIAITPDDAVLHVSVSGVTKAITLPSGALPLPDVVVGINAAQAGITARIEDIEIEALPADQGPAPPANGHGRKHLVLAHAARGQKGQLTVYANPSLGFPRAINAANSYVDTYLSAAVRSFFAQGGRKCYVVRMGDPLPLDAAQNEKLGQFSRLLWGDASLWQSGRQLADLLGANLPHLPSPAEPPETWHGIAHIRGLPDVTYISLPDLPDLIAAPPAPAPAIKIKSNRELYVECAPSVAAAGPRRSRRWPPPRADETGLGVWARIIHYLQRFVASTFREMQLVASLPLPHLDLAKNFEEFVRDSWFKEPVSGEKITSHYLQLGFPWLKTSDAVALPGEVEPPEGVLIGLLAANALTDGAYTSAAGIYVRQVFDLMPSHLNGIYNRPTGNGRPLSQRISMFNQTPAGVQLYSDVTTSSDLYYQHGAVRRLIALIVRAARHQGWSTVFEPQSPFTWQAVEKNISTLLTGIYEAGGLRGRTPQEAFSVTCDRSTMTQNDIDQGRLIADISVWPAIPIERIMVTLMLADGQSIVLRRAA